MTPTHLSLLPESRHKLLPPQWGANHAAIRAGRGAGEARLGGAILDLHGGKGNAGHPASRCGQEAAGPLEALHGRSGDWRPRHGNV